MTTSYPIYTPSDNRRLTEDELSRAKAICNEVLQSVQDRAGFISENAIDPKFAMPDANWSYDAPNEFVKLFIRVSKSDKTEIENLRAFCQIFSGYNLYGVCDGKGIRSSDFLLSDDTGAQVEQNIKSRGSPFVDEHFRMVEGLSSRYVFSPPALLGECGYVTNGIIVNNDTNTYQERINLIYDSGIGDYLDQLTRVKDEIRIMEIGGGYGALAYWFKEAFPQCSYTIVDLPESILFSKLYLTLTRPDVPASFGLERARYGFQYTPNYMVEKLEGSFDLIINTLSMSEMSAYQVERYIDLIKNSWIARGGLFFEQNQDNKHMDLLFAQEQFSSMFPHKLKLGTDSRKFRNGHPNVWSNFPISLHGNKRSNRRSRQPVFMKESGAYNIVEFDGKVFAIPQGTQIDWENDAVANIKGVRVADSVDCAIALIPEAKALAPTLLQSVGHYNVVQFQGRYFAIPHGQEIDWEGNDIAGIPGVFVDDNIDVVKAAALQYEISAHPPVLVQTVGRYNIVRFQRKYCAIPLGHAIDWKENKVDEMAEIFADDSLDAVIAFALKHAPPPVLLRTIGQCNIVTYRERYFAIPHGVEVDWTSDQVAEIPGVFVHESEDAIIAIAQRHEFAMRPPILTRTVGNYNIVRFREKHFAVPHGLMVDWEHDQVADIPGILVADQHDALQDMLAAVSN